MHVSPKVFERSACRRLSSYQRDKSKCLCKINVPLMPVWIILSAHLMWFCRTRSPMVTLRNVLPPLFYGTSWVIREVQKYHDPMSCFLFIISVFRFLCTKMQYHDIDFITLLSFSLFTATSCTVNVRVYVFTVGLNIVCAAPFFKNTLFAK